MTFLEQKAARTSAVRVGVKPYISGVQSALRGTTCHERTVVWVQHTAAHSRNCLHACFESCWPQKAIHPAEAAVNVVASLDSSAVSSCSGSSLHWILSKLPKLLGSQGKGEGTQKEKRLLHSSRFKSAVCSGGCGWTALFLRYAASVNWKPGCLAATRQERIPEADKEKSAQHKVMTPM